MVSAVQGINTTESQDKDTASKKKRLLDACRDFEAVMTNFMLKTMRESVMKSSDPDQAREYYEGMLDETVSRTVARREHHGLAEKLYKQLEPLVKVENHKKAASEQAAPTEKVIANGV